MGHLPFQEQVHLTFPTGLPALFVKSNISGFGKALPTAPESASTDFATLLGALETATETTATVINIRPQSATATKSKDTDVKADSPKPAEEKLVTQPLTTSTKGEAEPQEAATPPANAFLLTALAPVKTEALPLAINLPAAESPVDPNQKESDEGTSDLYTLQEAPAEMGVADQPPVVPVAMTRLPRPSVRLNAEWSQAAIDPPLSFAKPTLQAQTDVPAITQQPTAKLVATVPARTIDATAKPAPAPTNRTKTTRTETTPALTVAAPSFKAAPTFTSPKPATSIPVDSGQPAIKPEAPQQESDSRQPSSAAIDLPAQPQIEIANANLVAAPVKAESVHPFAKPEISEVPRSKEDERQIPNSQAPTLSVTTGPISLDANRPLPPVPQAEPPASEQPDPTSLDTDAAPVELPSLGPAPKIVAPDFTAAPLPVLTPAVQGPAEFEVGPAKLEARPSKRDAETEPQDEDTPKQLTPMQQTVPAPLPVFTNIAAPTIPESGSAPSPRAQSKTSSASVPQSGSALPLQMPGTKQTTPAPLSPIAFEAKLTPVEAKNPDQPKVQTAAPAMPQPTAPATAQYRTEPVTQKEADAPQQDAKHPEKTATLDVKTARETDTSASVSQPHLTRTTEAPAKVVNEAAVPVPTAHTTEMSRTPAQDKSAPVVPPTPVIDELPVLKTEPARDISFRVTSNTSDAVDVTLVDRAGQIHVDVRSADPALTQSLQNNVAELAGKLEQSGFHAETSIPNHARSLSDSQLSNPQQSSAFQNAQQQQQQEQQQRRAPQQDFEQPKKRNAPNTETFTLTPDQENA